MKKIFLKSLKIILCFFIIIIFPFIFPIISRFLVHIHLFTSVEDIKNYFSISCNWFFVIFVIIALLAAYLLICDKDKLIKWLEKRNFKLKLKDAELESISAGNEMVEESDRKKTFTIGNIDSNIKDETKTSMLEMKEQLIENIVQNEKENESNEILKDENMTLRFYGAYNIINKKAKELLNAIYCEGSMDLAVFKCRLIASFKNRNKKNKNLSKSQVIEYANNKYETIKEGLQFLNIIEITDDDETITLTQYGKEFVKNYIVKEVGENDS